MHKGIVKKHFLAVRKVGVKILFSQFFYALGGHAKE